MWDYGITSFASEWEAATNVSVGLSCSDQNGSDDDSPRSQIQATPTNRLGFGCGLGEDLVGVLGVW